MADFINTQTVDQTVSRPDQAKISFLVAAATTDGVNVDQHFGRADAFRIFEVAGDAITDTGEVRRVAPACHGGSHEDSHLAANARAIADCRYVLVARIGNQAEAACCEAGVIPMEIPGDIRAAVKKIRDYEKIQALFE